MTVGTPVGTVATVTADMTCLGPGTVHNHMATD